MGYIIITCVSFILYNVGFLSFHPIVTEHRDEYTKRHVYEAQRCKCEQTHCIAIKNGNVGSGGGSPRPSSLLIKLMVVWKLL